MEDNREYNNHSSQDEYSLRDFLIDIKDIIHLLKTKVLQILLISFFVAMLGFLYANFFNKVQYVAGVTFALEETQGASGGALGSALGIASSLGLDFGSSSSGIFSGNNIIELIKTRKLIEKALLRAYNNDTSKTFASEYLRITGIEDSWDEGLKKKIVYKTNESRNSFSLQQDSVLGILHNRILKKNLSVSQTDKKSIFIKVQFKFEDEIFAKNFVSLLIQEVSDYYILTKSLRASKNVEILERQVDSIRSELNNAITGVASANDETYNLNPALNIKRTPSAKRQIDVQANTAILTELVKNLALAKLTLLKETPLVNVISEPILPLEKEGRKRVIISLISFIITSILTSGWFIFQKRINEGNFL